MIHMGKNSLATVGIVPAFKRPRCLESLWQYAQVSRSKADQPPVLCPMADAQASFPVSLEVIAGEQSDKYVMPMEDFVGYQLDV
ncbi:hypothetical protein ACS7SF_23150 (plasmid) [Ralstonia sp. 25C]|uniref:hypothetical protein n=1 Tax=Ralstonia sp. 25C TaxID=3447363 RepID=UPI003F74CD0F